MLEVQRLSGIARTFLVFLRWSFATGLAFNFILAVYGWDRVGWRSRPQCWLSTPPP